MKKKSNYRKKTLLLSSVIALVCFLLSYSCATKPPYEKGNFKKSDLVELTKLDSTIQLDIRYATKNNLVGSPVYTEARAFLQRPAAEALVKVNEELKPLGYGLLVFDGYRPWSVTKLFWDITPEEDKKFVANPKDGSRHNRGCAVDLSLYELKSGKEIQMTGVYDEMSERSYKNYSGGTEEQRKMRDLLIRKMESNGFEVYEYEWWHFDYNGWETYRIQNIQFSEIK
ncbi:M15 family metallopeptidase [Aequorivita sp. Q41]|uniref:M15 family metallopeptidase n=1 Tax=Aequorivita sp. Q41 TaxID=3153300 RepID=UPI003241BDD4